MKLALLALFVVMLSSACASARQEEQELRKLSGMQLYERLCSSCHGISGKGDGPVAPLIKTGVPDLTRIAQRDGGEFPTEDVRRTIDGRWDRRAHGARDMPVWGWQLYDASSGNDAEERAIVDSMIDRLVNYLRGIQVE
ncbi:MAG TPA: cytochrome c [Steroidobacteraceae bacterium]